MLIMNFFEKASQAIVFEERCTDSEREEEPVLTPSSNVDLVTLGHFGGPSDESTGPSAAKRWALCSDHGCGMWQASLGLRSMLIIGITFSLTTLSLVLISVFRSRKMAVHFSYNGCNCFLGLCIVNKRMVASVFLVCFLLQVVTMGAIPVYLLAIH